MAGSTSSRRLADIRRDVAAASSRLLELEERPRILSIREEDETVTFQLEGFEQFTVCLPDTYPGALSVFGPDDFEFEHHGTIQEVVLAVRESFGRHGLQPDKMTALREPSPQATKLLCEQPEPLLQRQLKTAQELFGHGAVQLAGLSEAWRIRLHVRLAVGKSGGVLRPLLSQTTADAWGVDASLPVTMELQVPQHGYMRASMPAEFVKHVWQDGFPEFQLEGQLKTILQDFGSIALGRPRIAPAATAPDGSALFSEEQLDLIEVADLQKAQMISAAMADEELGFLGHLMLYMQTRIAGMHNYCALCDQAFGLPAMLMRTVCCRPLCSHQFAEFGTKITSAEGVNTQAEIAELLAFMFARAVESHRKELVLVPYPTVYKGSTAIFHPNHRDYGQLSTTVKELMALRDQSGPSVGASWTCLTGQMSDAGAGLMKWLLASNRTYVAPLDNDQRIAALHTDFQYLLISASPEKEARFQKLKRQHGSLFAFHGSHVGNWHSILRNGLKNASGTAMQSGGAAFGAGIYMATTKSYSAQYSLGPHGGGWHNRWTDPQQGATAPPSTAGHSTGNRLLQHSDTRVAVMALCEVVRSETLKTHDWGYVAPDEDTVVTRLLLVYENVYEHDTQVTAELERELRWLMDKLSVGGGDACDVGAEIPTSRHQAKRPRQDK